MAGSASGYTNYGNANQKQLINGKEYIMYTPEWQAATDAESQRQAGLEGAKAGTAQKAAFSAQFPGYPDVPGGASSPASQNATANDALDLLWRQQHGGAPLGSAGSTGGGSTSAGAPRTAAPVASGGQGGNPPMPQGGDMSSGGQWDYQASLAGLKAAAAGIAAPLPGQSSTTPPVTAPAPINYDATSGATENTARAATFARTKDNAAKTADASLTGLQDALAGRGLTGGGYEAGQIGSTLSREANTIGEGDRQQAESELSHEADVAHEDFQGKIAQRGQDIQAQTAQNNHQVQQAQLALQQRTASLAGLSAALNTSSRGVY